MDLFDITKHKEVNIKCIKQAATFLLTISLSSFALSSPGPITKVPIVDLEIKNDQLMTTTRYPNTCLEPWLTHKVTKNKHIVLLHFAEQFGDTVCTKAVQFRNFAFDLSNLDKSEYKIIDGFDSKVIGIINMDSKKVFLETSL